MKRYWIFPLVCLAAVLASCSTDDGDSTDGTDYCYIKSVTLGTVKRQVHVLQDDGTDSIYSSTFTGSAYEMTVDQRSNTIENRDSLLYGAKLDAVLITVSYDGGVVAWRKAGTEDDWTTYSSTDSVDLTEPIELYTLANDGNSYRIYTMKVNVHQQDGDSLKMCRLDSTAVFEDMLDYRAEALGERLCVLGRTAAGIKVAQRLLTDTLGVWTAQVSAQLPAGTDVQTLTQHDGTLYVSTAEGQIYSSTDALNWTAVGTAVAGLRLIARTEGYYYALADGVLKKSADASTWEAEPLDDKAENLPCTMIRTAKVTQTNGIERLLLMGYTADASDTTAVVWSKSWNRYGSEATAEWMFYTPTSDNKYRMPQLQCLNMMPYDGRLLAFGGASVEGKGTHTPFDLLYFSNDYGITWREDVDMDIDCSTAGLDQVNGPVAAAVDRNNFIWVISGGKVWRGRLNRLGFARQ